MNMNFEIGDHVYVCNDSETLGEIIDINFHLCTVEFEDGHQRTYNADQLCLQ